MVPESAWAADEMPAQVKASKARRAARNPGENRMAESPRVNEEQATLGSTGSIQGVKTERRFRLRAKPEKRRGVVFSSRYALMMAMTASRILAAITAHS